MVYLHIRLSTFNFTFIVYFYHFLSCSFIKQNERYPLGRYQELVFFLYYSQLSKRLLTIALLSLF